MQEASVNLSFREPPEIWPLRFNPGKPLHYVPLDILTLLNGLCVSVQHENLIRGFHSVKVLDDRSQRAWQ